jgi:transcriptional regulator with XRE-family HTH domain
MDYLRRLRELRLENKYTIEQAAEKLGITKRSYARLESGKDSITVFDYIALTNYFTGKDKQCDLF